MVKVKVINGNIEKAIQILKRQMKDQGIFIELREREQYTKPSEQRRKARAIARLREKYRTADAEPRK
jgi:small subunit ribosomal protein S21